MIAILDIPGTLHRHFAEALAQWEDEGIITRCKLHWADGRLTVYVDPMTDAHAARIVQMRVLAKAVMRRQARNIAAVAAPTRYDTPIIAAMNEIVRLHAERQQLNRENGDTL